MVVLGGGSVSYERGTPVEQRCWASGNGKLENWSFFVYFREIIGTKVDKMAPISRFPANLSGWENMARRIAIASKVAQRYGPPGNGNLKNWSSLCPLLRNSWYKVNKWL